MYHFGLKVGESDDELREAQQRLAEEGVPVVGASDHTVTHSLYILDPDGNEVELYIDVQPEVWHDDPGRHLLADQAAAALAVSLVGHPWVDKNIRASSAEATCPLGAAGGGRSPQNPIHRAVSHRRAETGISGCRA